MTAQQKNKEAALDAEAVRKALAYCPVTGRMVWALSPCRNTPIGKVAGRLRKDGYIAISIKNRMYFAHRLVWLHAYGVWPPDQVDHIDGNRSNNSIRNLRLATKSLNGINQKIRSDSASGLKGVQRHQNKWAARLVVNGRRRRLGLFDTPEAAHAAYVAEATKHFGEFARAS